MFYSQGSSLDALMFQGIADDPGNYDLEACGELLNPEEVRGKICVVTRGSCFFSSKTLACQRAGAVAAIIVNDAMDEGAADNWVTSHDPAGILIPTVSYGAVQGNQLLREMDTSAMRTFRLNAVSGSAPCPSWIPSAKAFYDPSGVSERKSFPFNAWFLARSLTD